MKILYIDLKYDYGIKNRGLNHIGQDGFIKSFQKLGYELDTFYYDEYLKQKNQLQENVIKKAKEYKPDIIFFQLFTDQFQIETLDYLKSKHITIAWFGDDNWRFDIYSQYLANHFSWCITTDIFSISKYRSIGQKNVILSQWAAIDSHAIPQKRKQYKYNVSFVGAISPYRVWFLDTLKKRGIDVSVFGIGWPNGQVSSTEMNEIFMNSKINLNISNSESFDLRYILHIPIRFSDLFSRNPKINIKKLAPKIREIKKIITKGRGVKNSESIKARNFEIPYFGGFQLSYYFHGIEDYFTVGKEIACYGNIDELEILIQYYLKNEDLREKIALRAHKRALKEHGYKTRIKSILNQIISTNKNHQ